MVKKENRNFQILPFYFSKIQRKGVEKIDR